MTESHLAGGAPGCRLFQCAFMLSPYRVQALSNSEALGSLCPRPPAGSRLSIAQQPRDPPPTGSSFIMKSWTFVVAGLYALVLAMLTLPVLTLGTGMWPTLDMVASTFGEWRYWALLLVMGGCQLALLTVPVHIANRRPVTRGALWPTIAAAAGAMALLGGGALLSIYPIIVGDRDGPQWPLWGIAAVVIGLWALWGVLFHRLSRTQPHLDFISNLCARLVRGSILELLVAVPCHVFVRCREYCCAGVYTMFGLAMGMAVMLFAFGPAVFFLFVARARKLQCASAGAAARPTPPSAP